VAESPCSRSCEATSCCDKSILTPPSADKSDELDDEFEMDDPVDFFAPPVDPSKLSLSLVGGIIESTLAFNDP
jgi:hypothetical protein